MPLRTAASQLLIYDPDHHRSVVHAGIASPSPLEAQMLGTLFFLVEIEQESETGIGLIRSLQQEVMKRYYEGDDLQIERAFERSLQGANETIHALLGRETANWLPRFHCIIGVVKDTTLHFTVVGRLNAFLIHRQRILNILDTPDGKRDGPDPLKIFSTIISGELQANDIAFFCTTSILDHLSQEKIRRTFLDRDPSDGFSQLELLLSSAEGPIPFGAVAVKLLETAKAVETTSQDQPSIHQPQDSMAALIEKERATSNLLNHSLWPTLGRIMKNEVSAVAKKMSGDRELESPVQPMAKFQESSRIRHALRLLLAGLVSLTQILISALLAAGRWVWRLAGDRQAARSSFERASGGTNRTFARGANWIVGLTPNRRRILFAAIILLILFAQSIVSLGERREARKRDDSYRAAVNAAREKSDAADAALLIQNESGARKLLAEAAAQLDTIPEGAKSFRDDVASVQRLLAEKQQKLRHEETVTLETIFDLGTLDVDQRVSALGNAGDVFASFHAENDTVYRMDGKEKNGSTLLEAPSLESRLARFVSGSGRTVLILQKNGNLQQIDFSGKKLVPIAVAYENVERDVQDAALYNGRLYTLDVLNNQIFRHDAVASGYGLGASWLRTERPDIRDARSMAVDGSIYIAKANGEILKFAAGAKQDTTFDPVDPVLTAPSVLRVNETTIFILDPSNKRIIAFGKDGAFQKQYANEGFAEAKDFTVVGKDVTVLAGTRLLRFTTE